MLEAVTLLIAARLLVARVPLARWRRSLGAHAPIVAPTPGTWLPGNLTARRLAWAVDRAASSLPGRTLCLPRAMALQWMLRRRGLGGTLVIGVHPQRRRGGLDDLHAWVARNGEILIGSIDPMPSPIYAARV